MGKSFGTGLLTLVVACSVVLQFAATGSAFVAVTAGFFLVAGGTLLMAHMSHSARSLQQLRRALKELRLKAADSAHATKQLEPFLRAANFFRYGNIRPAEDAARAIERPVLRRGTLLVLDGFQRQQLAMAMQRQIAEEREQLVAPVELLRSMAGFAPTLGMLGTLLGLVQMLLGVGAGDTAAMGTAMGFAMVTTVYGLVLANLVLKPLAAKLEQSNRQALTQCIVDMQAVMLLYERRHPQYILEVIQNPTARPQAEGTATQTGVIAGAHA